MSDSKPSSSSGGIGLLGVLGLIFVTLKLCGVIDWSWWWVTLPFWGWIPVLFLLFAVTGTILVGSILMAKLRG